MDAIAAVAPAARIAGGGDGAVRTSRGTASHARRRARAAARSCSPLRPRGAHTSAGRHAIRPAASLERRAPGAVCGTDSAPQVAARPRSSNQGSRWSRTAVQSAAACAASSALAAQVSAGRFHRRDRAAQAQVERPARPARPSNWRSAATAGRPIRSSARSASAWLHSKFRVASAGATGSTLRLTSVITPSVPSDPASTRETS